MSGREAPAPAAIGMGRLGRHTLVYGAGIVLGRAVSFFMLPLYTHYLTPADYGVMQLVDMTLEIVAIFAGTRIAGGVYRFYNAATTEAERRAVLNTAMTLLTLSLTAFGVVTALLAVPISRLVFGAPTQAMLIRLAAANLATSSLVVVPFALYQLEERSLRYVGVTTVKLVLQLTLNILLLARFGMGVKGVFISTLIANTATGLWLAVPFVARFGVHLSRGMAMRLLRYGLPLVLSHLAVFIVNFGDRYFLRPSGGEEAVGLYSLAYQFGFILVMLAGVPFNLIWEPMQFQMAKRPDYQAVFGRAFIFRNLLLFGIAVGIALFVDDFIRVMAAPAYWSAADLVPIILLAYVLQSWSAFVEVGMLVKGRTELLTLASWLSTATALAGYALLIPRWLGLGAAIATVLAFAVRLVVSRALSQRQFPIPLPWTALSRLVAIAVVVSLAPRLLPPLPLWESLLLRSLVYAIFVGAVWNAGVIPVDDRAMIRATTVKFLSTMRSRMLHAW